MNQQIEVRPLDVQLMGNAQEMAKRNQEAAEVLMKFVRDKKLAQKFGGQAEHIFNPAWQFLAHMYGIALSAPEVKPLVDERSGAYGFNARAVAVVIATGTVIAEAWASCFDDEANWDTRPKYEGKGDQRKVVGTVRVPSFQLQSMAQTRAQSKVAKSVLGFVVVMAGFDPTPAEEMTGSETEHSTTNGNHSQTADKPKVITDPQRKRIFALRHKSGMPVDKLNALIAEHGFKQSFEITVDKYEAICAKVEAYK